MGRFTMRDEGKTICIGKVLKYKPYTKAITSGPAATSASSTGVSSVQKNIEELKLQASATNEMIYDMETG